MEPFYCVFGSILLDFSTKHAVNFFSVLKTGAYMMLPLLNCSSFLVYCRHHDGFSVIFLAAMQFLKFLAAGLQQTERQRFQVLSFIHPISLFLSVRQHALQNLALFPPIAEYHSQYIA